MEKFIIELISLYKDDRAKFLDSVYRDKDSWLVRLFRNRINPSGNDILIKELDFQKEFIENVSALQQFRNLRSKMEWSGLILFIKNKTERLGFQIDYLNYFHTFLAFILVIFMLIAQKVPSVVNWLEVIIIGGFILKVFVDRTNLRRELTIYKEILNLIEANKEKLS